MTNGFLQWLQFMGLDKRELGDDGRMAMAKQLAESAWKAATIRAAAIARDHNPTDPWDSPMQIADKIEGIA